MPNRALLPFGVSDTHSWTLPCMSKIPLGVTHSRNVPPASIALSPALVGDERHLVGAGARRWRRPRRVAIGNRLFLATVAAGDDEEHEEKRALVHLVGAYVGSRGRSWNTSSYDGTHMALTLAHSR